MLCTSCNTGYKVSGKNVFYVTWDEGRGRIERQLVEADSTTFQTIKKKLYAKDKNAVYLRGDVIDGADPTTFKILPHKHSLDAHQVFFRRELVEGADPSTFQVLDQTWARDGADVFIGTRAIEACDSATFEIIEFPWAKDKECVYAIFNKLVDADPVTFEALNRNYAVDKNHVYAGFVRKISLGDLRRLPTAFQKQHSNRVNSDLYLVDRIEGADRKTFIVDADNAYKARDQFRCYDREVVADCVENE
jgi:hypothetical protein